MISDQLRTRLGIFHCAPLDCELSSAACAGRYKNAQKENHPASTQVCRTCDDGRARAGMIKASAPRRKRSQFTEVRRDGCRVLLQCTCGRLRWKLISEWEGPKPPTSCFECWSPRPDQRSVPALLPGGRGEVKDKYTRRVDEEEGQREAREILGGYDRRRRAKG